MDMNSEWRNQQPPPPLEEEYWETLLQEGEHARSIHHNGNGHSVYSMENLHTNGHHSKQRIDDTQIPIEDISEDWRLIQEVMDQDDVIQLKVIGYNRGGLLVEWRHIRGFVPASQLMEFPTQANANIRRDVLIDRIGQFLTLRVIELNREQNRLILSERAAQVRPGRREQILDDLKPGDTIQGDVTNICDFGVFVDLGGLEGLIHISELSWGRVAHPGDVLQRGDRVQVFVLDVQKNAGRVALSVKRLSPDPWQTVKQRYQIGEVIAVKVTNVVDFGAFACIEEGLEGLIHVSELAEGHFLHPRNVVQEGQTIFARILSIDPELRRLGLSLREIQQSSDSD